MSRGLRPHGRHPRIAKGDQNSYLHLARQSVEKTGHTREATSPCLPFGCTLIHYRATVAVVTGAAITSAVMLSLHGHSCVRARLTAALRSVHLPKCRPNATGGPMADAADRAKHARAKRSRGEKEEKEKERPVEPRKKGKKRKTKQKKRPTRAVAFALYLFFFASLLFPRVR